MDIGARVPDMLQTRLQLLQLGRTHILLLAFVLFLRFDTSNTLLNRHWILLALNSLSQFLLVRLLTP